MFQVVFRYHTLEILLQMGHPRSGLNIYIYRNLLTNYTNKTLCDNTQYTLAYQ